MKTIFSGVFRYNYVLTEQELRRVYDVMLRQMQQVTDSFKSIFTLTFKNKVNVELSSLDDIFLEENGGIWKIEELKITLFDTKLLQPRDSITLIYANVFSKGEKILENYVGVIKYDLYGDDRNWAHITSSLLEDRIAKNRNRFPNIFHIKSPIVNRRWYYALLLFSNALLAFISFNFIEISLFSGLKSVNEIVTLVSSTLVFVPTIAFFVWHITPMNCFLWSNYVKIYKMRRSIARYIILSIIVASVLGVLAGIIANYISTKIGIS
jgi:hypothetical protein